MLRCEALEGRECPAVLFDFHYSPADPFFTAEARRAMDLAGRAVGGPLNPTDLPNRIPVAVSTMPFPDALARGGPTGTLGSGGITIFDPRVRWHFGPTTTGLDYTEVDFVTIASHELLHVLGIGTVAGWDAGSRARGVAIAPDGQHFSGWVAATGSAAAGAPGRRLTPTSTDLLALSDLGWNATLPVGPAFDFLTIAGPDGVVRAYVAAQGRVFELGVLGGFHLQFQDFDFDGRLDVRFVTSGPGVDVTYAADGSLLAEPEFTFGVPFVQTRYGL